MKPPTSMSIFTATVLAIGLASPTFSQIGSTSRISLACDGAQPNSLCTYPSMSPDGRYVAFDSNATNLVPGDTNASIDVFVVDRWLGTVTRASVSATGVQGNAHSQRPSISADGSAVAFFSTATNLVPGDTNGVTDVFVRDLRLNTTTRISVASTGLQGNAMSSQCAISDDSRYVAFQSNASNLVPLDYNGVWDIFVFDRSYATTSIVSVKTSGGQGTYHSYIPSITANGDLVAFYSEATDLVPGDTNYVADVFVRDRQNGTTVRVSVSSAGEQGDNASNFPKISNDGSTVVYQSLATNLVDGDTNAAMDVFAYDRSSRSTRRLSVDAGGVQGNSYSNYPYVSADGRFVAFPSLANNLVPGDTNGYSDEFLVDRVAGSIKRVSVSSSGVQGNLDSQYQPAISWDGAFVAFCSGAGNLVPGDTNGYYDIFMHQAGPSYVNISGTVALVDFSGNIDLENVDFELRDGSGAIVQTISNVNLGAAGEYSFTTTLLGSYSVSVKGRTWLRRTIPDVLIPKSGVTGLDFALVNGDVDGDNEISLADYGLLAISFGSTYGDPNWHSNADLDGDGEVTLGDYSILARNFGQTGDE